MRKYILILSIALLTGCKSDYLNNDPNSSTNPKELYATTTNAKNAVNGMAKLMIRQYNSQGFNGEGTIKMYYGNYGGSHFYKNLPGWANVMNLVVASNDNSTYTIYPWYYYYNIISNANELIHYIDKSQGTEAERMYIKAQGLTFRAYSYMMLCQLYGPRWSSTNNGDTKCLVIKLNPNKDPEPLSSLADTYKQIYDDLDEAIRLFEASKIRRPNNRFYEPNIDVAYATYARAALNKEDYANAAKYAPLAYNNYPLMSNFEYNSGFSQVNQEWIWGSYNAPDETLYFWSYFAYLAYNSTASAVRAYPGCISRVLYNKIPETDIRKKLFLNPGNDFIPSSTGSIADSSDLAKRYRELFPDLQSDATLYRYMSFKFRATYQPGVGELNHFRSAEMYLIEAEALYKLDKETEAQQIMNKLNTLRNPEYNCTATGESLFEEIKIYRGIELWGEGFDWFDLKRWGDDRVRNSYKTSSSTLPNDLYDQYPALLGTTIEASNLPYWTYVTPKKETDYNPEIN